MAKHTWNDGSVTSTGEWTSWRAHEDGALIKFQHDGTWIHILASVADEPKPNDNHVHFKFKMDGGHPHSYVLCCVKVDGMREINRRRLIEEINSITGLNLSYR